MTTFIRVVKREQPFFLNTDIKVGDDSILALGAVWQDPAQATAEKPGIVEYFWHVRRSDQVDAWNMQLSYVSFAPGSRVSMANERNYAQSATEESSYQW